MNADHWRNRRLLVTGASGFVGWRLTRALLERSAEVFCLLRDHDPVAPLFFAGDIRRVHVISGELGDIDTIRRAITEHDIDTVFHLGAQALVHVGQRDPLTTFESNIRGTYNLLEVCRLYGETVQRIVIASSDKAYGPCEFLPYTEETPLAAANPYDVSKSCADLIAQSYWHTWRLPIAIARCGNIFGGGDLNFSRIVPDVIRSLMRSENPVIRSDGSPKRDYLYVDDAVAGYLALAAWLDCPGTIDDEQRAFNFSSERPLTVLEMVRHVAQAVGRADLEPIVRGDAVGEIQEQWLDASRARTVLNWQAQTDLVVALIHTVAWYREYIGRAEHDERAAQSHAVAPIPGAGAVR